MSNKHKTVFDNCNLNTIAEEFCKAIEDAYGKFWEQDSKVILQAINNYREIRNEKLIANVDFFSSQIKVEKHKPVLVRLSKEFVEDVLDTVLQSNTENFEFTKLTQLEIKILNSFCEFIYKKIKKVLISQQETKITEKSEQNFNLLFSVVTKTGNCSKIMLSIPEDRIKLTPLKRVETFSDEDFLSSQTTLRIRAGSTKVTLDELENLSPDDIVILDDSELSKLIILSGDIKQKFNVAINSSMVLDINNDDETEEENIEKYNEVSMNKNLWDDIQIEVNAEFEKVKMTIGELKQITQGQIVDLGALVNNEISLFVEDRKVAKGELIIINDRYAVRLNEVLNSETIKTPNSIKLDVKASDKTKNQTAKPKPQINPQDDDDNQEEALEETKIDNEDEDFDYSDFEK